MGFIKLLRGCMVEKKVKNFCLIEIYVVVIFFKGMFDFGCWVFFLFRVYYFYFLMFLKVGGRGFGIFIFKVKNYIFFM